MRQGRREISIEFEEVVVIRRADRPILSWCRDCGERVPMLSTNRAAQIARITARTLFRWIESGRIHFLEIQDGSVLICLISLRSVTAHTDHTALARDIDDPSVAIDPYQLIEGEF